MGVFPDAEQLGARKNRANANSAALTNVKGHPTISPRRYLMPGARKDTTPITVDTPWFQSGAVELGDFTVAFETIREERDTAPAFKGLPDDRCPCPHWGLVVSGRFTARYHDHDETFEAGDVYYAAPGHLPRGTAGTELITFSPTVELEKVNVVLAKNRARLGASQS
jgi:hypothetical protein